MKNKTNKLISILMLMVISIANLKGGSDSFFVKDEINLPSSINFLTFSGGSDS